MTSERRAQTRRATERESTRKWQHHRRCEGADSHCMPASNRVVAFRVDSRPSAHAYGSNVWILSVKRLGTELELKSRGDKTGPPSDCSSQSRLRLVNHPCSMLKRRCPGRRLRVTGAEIPEKHTSASTTHQWSCGGDGSNDSV